MDNTDFEKEVKKIFDEAYILLLRKHKDYGPLNISSAPGGAINGLIVRKHDKFERIKNLFYNKPNEEPQFETLRETFIDDLNYSAIAIMNLDGTWPKQ
jgi:hypothetical protein